MRRLARSVPVAGPLLLAFGSAWIGARLLRPRGPVLEPAPVRAEDYFSAEEIERGRRFAPPQLAIGVARGVLELAVLAAVVRRAQAGGRMRAIRGRGARARVDGAWAGEFASGAVTGAALAVATTLAPLPLSALARRRAIAVGLITQPWRGWALDLVKSTAIAATLAAAVGGAATELTRRYPRGWWLGAAGGSVALGALLGALAPVLLDPAFNEFTPLPEEETRSDVLELARAAGVDVGEVYSVDASRRTTGANAYVTGLGPTKRVVLFDTLLDRYTRDEVRVVVAHELAHVRHRDVLRGVAFAAVVAPATALAVQRLSWRLSPERGTARALPALALAAAVVGAPVGLIGNTMTRAVERRADRYSLELSGSPEGFVSFERRIAVQNVADVRPPRWVSALLATHPPTLERIGTAVAYAHGAAGARASSS